MISKEEIMNNIIVVLVTTMGTLEIELYEDDAPITVKNFVSYVESGFFEETIFHRIIPGFVVQGGGHIFLEWNKKKLRNQFKMKPIMV